MGRTGQRMDEHAIYVQKMMIFQQILHFLQKHYQPTNGPTDRRTNRPTDGRTYPLIEMR